jgi:glucosamine--fructose-6-phosphate aminotransferase (isomerizing)
MGIKLGVQVALAAPSLFTMYGKNLNFDRTLVLGISQSGKAADVLEVLKAANAAGALTASITNFADSPLAAEAKYHFNLSAGLEKSVAATKTFTAQLTILAVLTAVWADDKALLEEIKKLPLGIEEILNNSGYISEKVQRYRFMNECFVLARGVNYSVALEFALKIQETCYVRAKAYPTSDFYHGPYAMIEKNMPVIVIAPEGPSLKDMKEMILKLKGSGAEIVVVSNNNELLELGDCALRIPDTDNDILSPFYNALIAQTFACNLSLARGLNPDSPRELSKVTITK